MTASPEPEPPAEDPDLVAARRVARIAVVALVALAVALVATFLVRQTTGDEPGTTVEAASGAPGAPGATVTHIGPAPGATVDDYIASRQPYLRAVADEDPRIAVVSFTRYRTEAEADAVLTDLGVDRALVVSARMVAAPGGEGSAVTGSLADWAAATAAKAEADRAQDEMILPTVEAGSDFVAFYRREIVRLAAVRDGATADGPVVFGLVVQAKGSTLRALAASSTVRLVDVGTSAEAADDASYAGLLPDDVATVSDPPQRPVPAK